MRIPFFDINITVNPGRIDHDHETVYEGVTLTLPNGREVGLALVKIDESGSEMHYHESTVETYILLSGSISVYRGDINSSVNLSTVGEAMKIPQDTVHSARSNDGASWFFVISSPALSESDHYIYDGKPIMH